MSINPLCNQTVTLYRHTAIGVERRVITGCFYSWQREVTAEGLEQTGFLLVLPPEASVQIGDRVFDGIGPEAVAWEAFLPVNTPGLSQVAYVKPCYFQGKLHHTEAGRK